MTQSLPLFWHPDIALHDAAAEHVAMAPNRLELIANHLVQLPCVDLVLPGKATLEDLVLAHDRGLLERLERSALLAPGEHDAFDRETRANRHTWAALTRSAGGWLMATRMALQGTAPASFVVSYAGHHARHDQLHGFCFVNGAGVAAHHALFMGAQRVAVLDFDTHSGDGTALAFLNDPRVFFGETFQGGFPGSFLVRPPAERICRRKVSHPSQFKDAWVDIFARVKSFNPELVLVSAGFDAHRDDPLSTVGVGDQVYTWLGEQLLGLGVPVVAGLEGGYNLDSTRRCAALFCQALAGSTQG